MYIDETGGLWLAGPGGLLLALAALGLVLWAQSGLGMAGLVRLLPRRSPGPRRRRVIRGRPPVERFGRPGLGPRISRPAPAAMVVMPLRGTARQPIQWARSEHDRDTDLLPVA